MARALVEHHGGEVPDTMEALVELPGVGRKTANVVLGHALGVPGLAGRPPRLARLEPYRHRCHRRIPSRWSSSSVSALPPAEWTKASDTLILHGRRICKPKPLCDQCVVRDDCDFYRTLVAGPRRERSAGSVRLQADRNHANRKRFGQHFLEPVWADKVVDAISPARRRFISGDRTWGGDTDAAAGAKGIAPRRHRDRSRSHR